MLEGADLYLQHSNLCGGSEHLSSEPSFPTRPRTSYVPHQAVSQKHPQRFPLRLSVQDLEYIAISLCIIVQKSICRVILDHGETQERHRS